MGSCVVPARRATPPAVVDPLEPRLTVHRLVDGRFRQQATAAGAERYVADEPSRVAVTPADLVS